MEKFGHKCRENEKVWRSGSESGKMGGYKEGAKREEHK
jgi:hypothetical protein